MDPLVADGRHDDVDRRTPRTARRRSPAARCSTSTATARPRWSTATSSTCGSTTVRPATGCCCSDATPRAPGFEYPLVADVDSDGHADIVVVSNAFPGIVLRDGSQTRGVRIFGDDERQVGPHPPGLEPARLPRHQRERGRHDPRRRAANWTVPGLDNFRQNVQPEGELAAPDLVVDRGRRLCTVRYGIVARVRNIGQASVARRRGGRLLRRRPLRRAAPCSARRSPRSRSTSLGVEDVVLRARRPSPRAPSTRSSTTGCRCTPGTSAGPTTRRRPPTPPAPFLNSVGAGHGDAHRAFR